MGKSISISVNSPAEFHKARAALDNAGILISSINPGGAIGPIGLVHGFSNINGWLQIDASQAKRAEAILDELGIPNSLNARPIVDRSEPACPACAAELDPAGPEVCPNCERAFWWVDIDEPPLDPTGRACRNCGYDLTGNQMHRCPECGAPILHDADTLVEAADHCERLEPLAHSHNEPRMHWAVRLALFIAFALVASIGIAITVRKSNVPLDAALFLGIALIVLIFAAAVVMFAFIVGRLGR